LLLWRDAEITVAQGKFSRLSRQDLEDIYDDTADVLRKRPHKDEEHLQRALRVGVRLRGLRMIRDRNTRERVLADAALGLVAEAEARAWSAQPEQALIAQEEGLIISEFVAELTPEECQVFVLIAKGQSWRAIATSLGIDEKVSRNLTQECENKRKRFVTLYTTGRLCGYRSRIIDCLLSGEQQGEAALRQAVAHLQHCRECQAEHQITGPELCARFDEGALALLPVPLLTAHHASWLDHLQAVLQRPVRWLERVTTTNGAVRERAVEGVAGGAVAAKAAIAVGVIALGGAAIEVHHIVDPPRPPHHPSAPAPAQTGKPASILDALQGTGLDVFRPLAARTHPSRPHGLGHLVTHSSGPGHLVGSDTSGPGRLVGEGTGPGRLVTDTGAPTNAHTSSAGSSGPGRLVGSGTANSASAGTSPPVSARTTTAPSRLGRVLGP
jgi:DNA-directed RNA polymerase specialized sigma24 family protein